MLGQLLKINCIASSSSLMPWVSSFLRLGKTEVIWGNIFERYPLPYTYSSWILVKGEYPKIPEI